MQTARSTWKSMNAGLVHEIFRLYDHPELLEEYKRDLDDSEQMLILLQYLCLAKNSRDYEEEFGCLMFESPIRHSDFKARRERREKRLLEKELEEAVNDFLRQHNLRTKKE